MDEHRTTPRHSLQGEQACSLGVITYHSREWLDFAVRLKDMSERGVMVESERPLDPGFVWFNDRVGGNKGGVLVWCRKIDQRYLAGIRFVPLSRDEERIIQEQTVHAARHSPHRSPDQIISALIDAMSRYDKRSS